MPPGWEGSLGRLEMAKAERHLLSQLCPVARPLSFLPPVYFSLSILLRRICHGCCLHPLLTSFCHASRLFPSVVHLSSPQSEKTRLKTKKGYSLDIILGKKNDLF